MKLAIIGGSLLSEIKNLRVETEETISTPYGEPSGKFVTGRLASTDIIYLNRHGESHNLPPHKINYRANIFALKSLGVTHVISITAVGGITSQMSPMQWVVPDQLIDYTYGREHTYSDGNNADVNHIDFSYPFDKKLRKILHATVRNEGLSCINKATYGVTQGPRLETIAEVIRLEIDACDIVGMTAMPEAALSKELKINYATLSLVVNWAAGKGENQQRVVSMEEINQRINDGNEILAKIIKKLL